MHSSLVRYLSWPHPPTISIGVHCLENQSQLLFMFHAVIQELSEVYVAIFIQITHAEHLLQGEGGRTGNGGGGGGGGGGGEMGAMMGERWGEDGGGGGESDTRFFDAVIDTIDYTIRIACSDRC